MANDKKFIVKNGLLTPENAVIGSTTDTGEQLQVTGDTVLTQGTASTPTLKVTNSGGASASTIVAQFEGDSDSLQIKNFAAGDYSITNPQQNNEIRFYDGTGGIVIRYSGSDKLAFTSTGTDFTGLATTTIEGNRILTTADEGSGNGLDADTVDGLQASQFLRSDVADTAAGTITFSQDINVDGNAQIDGTLTVDTNAVIKALLDAQANAQVAGNLNVGGDLTVSGNTTYVNTEEILLSDNIITLNANYTGSSPSENAGIEIERGSLLNPKLIWNESNDWWQLEAGGAVIGRIITTADEGSGNGFDADTVDGLEGSQFLRSDVDDTAAGNITIEGDLTIGDNSGPAQIIFDGSGTNRQLYHNNGEIGFLNSSANWAMKSDAQGDLEVERDVQAGRDVIADNDVTATSGDVTAGDSITAQNNITATTGNITASAGSVTAQVNVTATTGNVSATAGDVTAGNDITAGQDITATAGDITASAGNIAATTGDVTAGNDVTAGQDITATSGNIAATAGSVSAGTSVTAGTTVTAGTDVIGQRFVDADNNGYVADPSGTSTMHEIGIDDNLFHNGDTDTRLQFSPDQIKLRTGGSDRLDINNSRVLANLDTYVPNLVVNDAIIHNNDTDTKIVFASDEVDIDTGGSTRLTANNSGVTVFGDLDVNGNITAVDGTFSGDLSASRFVDSDNTNYFLDPNSDSVLHSIGIDDYIVHNGDSNTYLGFDSNDNIVFHTAGAERFEINATNITGTVDGIFPNLFASRFYDSQNATYYLDPNSTSRVNDISLTGEIIHDGDTDTYLNFNGANSFEVVTGGNQRLLVNNSYVLANNQMRSPIYYDNNNTNYYGDFASTSQMAQIDIDSYIRHRGDTNTYLGFDANDSITFATGGAERLNITDANSTFYQPVIVQGDIQADRFVDRQNNSYYVNPADSSLSATLAGGIRIDAISNYSRWDDNSGNGGIALVGHGDVGDGNSSHIAVSGQYTGGYALMYLNRIDPTSNVTNSGNRYIAFRADGTAESTIRGDSSGNMYQVLSSGTNWGFWTSGYSEALIVDDSGNIMIANSTAPTYTTGDNTPVVGGALTTNKLHIGGSIQLTNNDDAIVIGRGTATFLKDEELGFGWGGGWYMTDGTYIRSRNNKHVYNQGAYYGNVFYSYQNAAYYADPDGTSNFNRLDIDEYLGHRGDTDTYLRFPSNDFITLATNNTARLNISNSTVRARNKLEVYGPGIEIQKGSNGGGVGITITDQNSGSENPGLSGLQQASMKVWHADNSVTSGANLAVVWESSEPTTHYVFGTNNNAAGGNIIPRVTNSGSLGLSNYRWSTIYAGTGNFSSDVTGNNAYFYRYYDRNDNAYYADPNGTSIFRGLQLNNPAGDTVLRFGPGLPSNDDAHIEWKGTNNAGYLRFSTADDSDAGSNEHMEFGDYAGTGRGGAFYRWARMQRAYLQHDASMRSPYFYASDNTAYYVDPNGDSQLNTIDIDDYIRHRGDTNTYFGFAANDTFRVWTNGTQRLNIDNNSLDSAVNVYAPRYYDSNATSRYIEPGGGGLLQGNFEFASSSTGTGYSTAAIELRESNYTGNATATPPMISFHWGGVVASSIAIEANGTIAIRNNPGTAYEKFRASIGTFDEADIGISRVSNYGYYGGNTQNGQSHYQWDGAGYRNPGTYTTRLYVRQDHTAGGLNNAIPGLALYNHRGIDQGTTMLAFASREADGSGNAVNLAGIIAKKEGAGTANAWSTGSLHFFTKAQGTRRDNMFMHQDGHVQSPFSFRAPIFYDSNNTGYYVDPASTSRFNLVQALRYYLHHGTSYYMDVASGSYGTMEVGGRRNGWAGYSIEGNYVFMANSSEMGIYNDIDNEWMIYGQRNGYVDFRYNGSRQAQTANGYFLANNQMRAPIYYDSNNTAYYANFAAGNTDRALRIAGRIRRDNFQTSGGGDNNRLLEAQDYSHWIWNTANNWGIFWAGNNNASYSHFSTSNPNEIVFVGSGNVRASIDLDNGNAYFQGEVAAGNFALNGGNENLSLSKLYTRGAADETLFDGTLYFEKRVIQNMQGAENYTTNVTSEFVKSSNAPGASSYVLRTNQYRNFYSDYIEVEPGEEVFGEIHARVISGSGGILYYGIERFDKDKRPIAGNTGTTYFVASGVNVTSTAWTTYRNHTTIPTSHTPYNGSDGGGVRYVRLRILYNYNSGGALREFTMPILKRTNYHSHVRTNYDVEGSVFRDTNNSSYYLDMDSVSYLNDIRPNIMYDRNNTGYYVDPASTTRLNRLYINARNDNYNVGSINTTNNQSNWQNLVNVNGQFTVTQYNAIQNYANSPGTAVYTYGSVLSARTANMGWQLYFAHTGDLAYKTQWNNDQYSGWLTPVVYGRNAGSASGKSVYGDVFYDTNNTAYYSNPHSESRYNTLRTAGRVVIGGTFQNNAYNSVSSTRLHFGGGNSDANGNYYIGTNLENYNGNYTKLDLRWHTGIRMGAQAVYGGTRIYNNEDLSTLLFSVGRSDTHTRVENSNLYVMNGDARAQIFYDIQDTNWYANPNGTSRFRELDVENNGSQEVFRAYRYGSAPGNYTTARTISQYGNHSWGIVHEFRIGEPGSQSVPGGTDRPSILFSTGYNSTTWSVGFGYVDNHFRIKENHGHINGGWGSERLRINTGGAVIIPGSLYAPIIYDNNNSGYYIDPNGNSRMNTILANRIYPCYDNNTGVYIDYPTGNYGSIQVNGGGRGGWEGYSINGRYVFMSADNNQMGIYNDIDNEWMLYGERNSHLYLYHNGTWEARTDSGYFRMERSGRAPIFYDLNDTGYYVDPNSTSNSSIRQRGGTLHGPNTSWGEYLAVGTNGHWSGSYASVASTNGNLHLDSKSGRDLYLQWYVGRTVYVQGAIQAQIYYDRDNTSYYGNFASTSYMNDVRANIFYERENTAYYFGSSQGDARMRNVRFNEVRVENGATIQSVNGAGRIYMGGNFHIDAQNGLDLYLNYYSGRRTRMYYTSNREGARLDTNGIFYAFSQMRTPLIYDYNNTGYYLDMNNNSRFNDLQLRGLYVTTRYHTGSDFTQGTLVRTSIPATATNGASFVLEATGKSYSGDPPFMFTAQGYLYANTIINYSGQHIGKAGFSTLYMFQYQGYLHFWWPRVSYWNSFAVHVRNANGDDRNLVTSITNSGLPGGRTKERQVAMRTTAMYNVNIGTGDMYATRYYDSNNTFYYGDFASGSRMNEINIYGSNRYQGGAPAYFYTSSGNLRGYIRATESNDSHFEFATSGGEDFIFRDGGFGGSWNQIIRGNGHVLVSSRFDTPIMYDRNNTGYYVNPASSSQFAQVYANDWFRPQGGSGLYFQSYGYGVRASGAEGNPYGNISTYGSGAGGWSGYGIDRKWTIMSSGTGNSNNFGIHNTDSSWLWYWNGSYTNTRLGYLNNESSMRAPIFYDSNNTSYYFNGASDNSTRFRGVSNETMAFMGLSGQTRSSKEYYAARPRITGDTNYWTGSVGWGRIDMNSVANWGSGFFDSWSNPPNQPSGTSHWVGVQAYHYSNGSARYGWQLAGGPIANLRFRNTWSGFSSWKTVPMLDVNSSNGGSMYAGRYYDSNNTGYYGDFASTSRMNVIDINEGYTRGWWRNNNSGQGLYNQSTGRHFYSPGSSYWHLDGGSSSGGLIIYDRYNGSQGSGTGRRGYIYYSGSGFGLLNSSGGWAVRVNPGSSYTEIYRQLYVSGDVRSPIYYDRDNTGYYFNGASAHSTRFEGVNNRTMAWLNKPGHTRNSGEYYRARPRQTSDTNYWTGAMGWGRVDMNAVATWGSGFIDSWSNPPNQPSGTSHWVGCQAFHYRNSNTSGYGWQMVGGPISNLRFRSSWSGWRSWRTIPILDENNGNGGAMYAGIYYDSNNAGYYVDPASTSNMNQVRAYVFDFNGTGGNSGRGIGSYPYELFQTSGSWSYPYPALRINYHVGIDFGANPSYQGFRFMNDYNSNTVRFQINGGSSYTYANTWLQVGGGGVGIYDGYNGAHWFPNNQTSYGSWASYGNRNGWYGVAYPQAGYDPHEMWDGSGNGGWYLQALGRWALYHNRGRNCMGVGSSSTVSGYRMRVNGSLYCDGNVVAYSDVRKKKNIVTIDNALDKVLQLRGVYYERIESKIDERDDLYKGRQVGMIAQEVAEIVPEVVSYAEEVDQYGLDYPKMVGLLVEGIKDQNAIVESQKETINNMQKDIDMLKEMVYNMQSIMENSSNGTN